MLWALVPDVGRRLHVEAARILGTHHLGFQHTLSEHLAPVPVVVPAGTKVLVDTRALLPCDAVPQNVWRNNPPGSPALGATVH